MTSIQDLLDAEAKLGNIYRDYPEMKELLPAREVIVNKIVELRGNDVPVCYGQDDCSTMILIRCPWRMTCGN